MPKGLRFIDALLEASGVEPATLGDEWHILRQLCTDKALSNNCVPDAWLAAAAIHQSEQVVTFDADFRRLLPRGQFIRLSILIYPSATYYWPSALFAGSSQRQVISSAFATPSLSGRRFCQFNNYVLIFRGRKGEHPQKRLKIANRRAVAMESKSAIHRTGSRHVTSPKVTPLQGQTMALRIELRDTDPAIYRVILVPARITLPKLHVTILWAMGWKGGHLHEFIINDTHYGEPEPDFPQLDLSNQQRVRLDKALGPTREFDYIYDFGDGWWHRIEIMEVTEFASPPRLPWCLDGRQACPPEDVGGVPGYLDFLKAMADPANPEHAQTMQWYGGPFDPGAFDLDEVNERLMQIQI